MVSRSRARRRRGHLEPFGFELVKQADSIRTAHEVRNHTQANNEPQERVKDVLAVV